MQPHRTATRKLDHISCGLNRSEKPSGPRREWARPEEEEEEEQEQEQGEKEEIQGGSV